MSFNPHGIPVVHEPFADFEQKRETWLGGMWLFLGTEVMFFGVLFLSYAIYHHQYPEVFAAYSSHLDAFWGTVNTGVLLTSSLFMALGVHAAHEKKNHQVVFYLAVTIALALVFCCIKAHEWHDDYLHGLVPGKWWWYSGKDSDVGELFFRMYFTMTGLHALHVLIGVGLMAWFLPGAWKGRYNGENYLPLEMLGLYWHFVDLVWIFLYPVFYLLSQ